jgi:hypothetical protein
MHGLRKTAALMLAEVSCATHEIASITGHAPLAEIEWYTKAVNQKKLATAAICKLETKATRTSSGKRSPLRVANGSQEVDAAMNHPAKINLSLTKSAKLAR